MDSIAQTDFPPSFACPQTDDCATAPCDANAQPVCASNGKTYSNICELTQTSCELKKVC